MSQRPRIAILGFSLEANRNAPVSDRHVFEQTLYWGKDEITHALSGDRTTLPGTVQGFCAAMDTASDWMPVPVLLAEAPPCKSSVAIMGTSEPTVVRTISNTAPSASSSSVVKPAPC